MEKNKPQKLKGGNHKMKTIGIFMTALMVFGLLASAGIVLAQEENQNGGTGGGYNGVQVYTMNAKETSALRIEKLAEGSVSSVEAFQAFSEDESLLDFQTFNNVIDEFDGSLSEKERKVGFLTGNYGRGHFINNEKDHLGLIQIVWVSALVTEFQDASVAEMKVAGKINVEGENYRLSLVSVNDKEITFDLISERGVDSGDLYLETIASYDDNTRKIWEGKIEINGVEGNVDLITLTKSVRKASEGELQRAGALTGGDKGDVGTNMPYPGQSSADNGPGNPVVQTEDRGFIERIFDIFRR